MFAYIDDVKTHTSAQLVEQIIELQLRKELTYGAFLKMDKDQILLEVCPTDAEAQALHSNFHQKFGILTERILIHPDNFTDPVSKAAAQVTYGDVILGIPASPFPEFIAALCRVKS